MQAFRKALGVAACAGFAAASAMDIEVKLGDRVVELGDKAGGLTQFPESPLTILATTPEYRALISSGTKTFYCKGPAMNALAATQIALAPSGKGYDSYTTHISGTWKDPGSNDIYAIFNSNDPEGMKNFPGGDVPGRYFSVGLAKSTDGGISFKKLGAIVQSPKDTLRGPLQGDGYPTVTIDKEGKYLYLYYSDFLHANAAAGVQTCMARSLLSDKGMPGTWYKYYEGEWKTKGISVLDTSDYTGLETTPVIRAPRLYGDAQFPSVIWSAKAQHYIMVYNVNHYDELGQTLPPEVSGVYVSFSTDGIEWFGQRQLLKLITIDYPGYEVGMHPTLVLDEAGSTTSLKGTLYYGYSAVMWTGTPQYLVSHSIEFGPLPFDFSSSIKPSAHPGKFTLRRGADGDMLLQFPGDVLDLGLVDAKGARAGHFRRTGFGQYRLTGARPGMFFLRGQAHEGAFARAVMLP